MFKHQGSSEMVFRKTATRLLLIIGACALRILRQLPAAVCIAVIVPSAIAGSRAQCVEGSCPPPGLRAVVRIVHAVGRCRLYASGTVVHDDGRSALVLSCAHLFNEGTGRVWVVFSDGRQAGAAPLAIDATWDLSALRINATGIEPIRLAAEAPRPGEPLQHCGYGPDGAYRCSGGHARGYTNGAGTTTFETLCLAGAARDGDSGGPVLNARGELVGVVWGTDGRTVHATYCGRVRRFLEKLLPAPPLPPDTPPESLAPPGSTSKRRPGRTSCRRPPARPPAPPRRACWPRCCRAYWPRWGGRRPLRWRRSSPCASGLRSSAEEPSAGKEKKPRPAVPVGCRARGTTNMPGSSTRCTPCRAAARRPTPRSAANTTANCARWRPAPTTPSRAGPNTSAAALATASCGFTTRSRCRQSRRRVQRSDRGFGVRGSVFLCSTRSQAPAWERSLRVQCFNSFPSSSLGTITEGPMFGFSVGRKGRDMR